MAWWYREGRKSGTWKAYGPDGTKYTFGASNDERMQVVIGCSEYATEYATMKWYLSEVEDTSGNTLSFTYDTRTRNIQYENCGTESYDRAMYPSKIEYGLNPAHGWDNPRVQISFEISSDEGTRYDVNSTWEEGNAQFRFHKEMLNQISIKVDDRGVGEFKTVRSYEFEYYDTSWGDNPEWLTLEQVRTVGRGGSSELPTMTFTYQNASAHSGIGDGHKKRKVLTGIDNGYGGRVEFDYDWLDVGWCYDDPCGTARRFRVKERRAYDGIGSTFVQRSGYTYHSPTGNQERGEFWGHAKVEETVYDGSTEVARTVTDFYQACEHNSCFEHLDPRQGRPKKITKYECPTTACDAEVYRVENTWGFAEAPEKEVAEGNYRVWQVMPVASSTYHYADQNEVRDWTLYLDDPYGNPAARFEYGIFAGDTSLDDTGTLTELKCATFDDEEVNSCLGNPGDDWEKWYKWAVLEEDAVSVSWVGHQVMMTRESAGDAQGVIYQGLDDNLEPNTEYQVTAWVRGEPGNQAKVELYAHNGDICGDNPPVDCNHHETGWTVPNDETWQLLRLVYTTDDEDNPKMLIHLAANFESGAGTVYWDNVIVAEVDTTGNDERTTHWQYYPNPQTANGGWIVNKVAQGTVYSGIQAEDDGGSSMVARTRYHYDMNDTVPRDWDDVPTQGLLTQEAHWVDDSTPWPDTPKTGYRYDVHGNLTHVIDPNDNTTTTYYDPDFFTFPVCVVNAKGHETETRYYGVRGLEQSQLQQRGRLEHDLGRRIFRAGGIGDRPERSRDKVPLRRVRAVDQGDPSLRQRH